MTDNYSGRPVGEAAAKYLAALSRFQRGEANATNAREIYTAMHDACLAYAMAPGREPFPPEIAWRLSDLLGTQLAGKPTKSFDGLLGDKVRGFTPPEARAVASAGLYYDAVTSGLITDHKHRKRLARWFGVEPRTVNDWMRRDRAPLSEFFPEAHPKDRALMIVKQAIRAGRSYGKYGRGQSAIRDRGHPIC